MVVVAAAAAGGGGDGSGSGGGSGGSGGGGDLRCPSTHLGCHPKRCALRPSTGLVLHGSLLASTYPAASAAAIGVGRRSVRPCGAAVMNPFRCAKIGELNPAIVRHEYVAAFMRLGAWGQDEE